MSAKNKEAVYALIGTDTEARQQALQRLRTDQQQSQTIERFDLKEDNLSTVLSAAKTLPFLEQARWIEVRHIDALSKENQALLLEYVQNPNPTTTLILVGTRIDGRSKLGKHLKTLPGWMSFELPNKRQLYPYLQKQAEMMGLRIDPETLSHWIDWLGTDPGELTRSLELVALYLQPSGPEDTDASSLTPVSWSEVSDLFGAPRTHDIFSFVESAASGSFAEVVLGLRRLNQHNEAPLKIVALLARQLRLLLRSKQGAPLSVPPFVQKKIRAQAQTIQTETLQSALHSLSTLEHALKVSPLPSEALFLRTIQAWSQPKV